MAAQIPSPQPPQPHLGEIRLFSGNFEPVGWMYCDGRTLPISEYEALFQILGTTYGGDGIVTFQLLDLRSRVPLATGSAFGLSDRTLAEAGGTETVTLTTQQIPLHGHALTAADVAPRCSSSSGTNRSPENRVFAVESAGVTALYSSAAPDADMAGLSGTASLALAGGSQPHENMPPFLCVNFIISVVPSETP